MASRSERSVFLCVFVVAFTHGVLAATVEVEQGMLQGKTIRLTDDEFSIDKEIDVYLGVPYANPPQRFKPPVTPPASWSGTLNVTTFSPACVQFTEGQAVDLSIGADEDCLYLNVFSPSPKPTDSAVMVWIHGGGFSTGSAMAYEYSGVPLAAFGDVIVVTINYRLGVFAKLTTRNDDAPGNVGMLDQVAALEWIHTNIAAFGGDQDRITLFGESAGAAAVEFHTLSKLSQGLFSQVIMQSGTTYPAWALERGSPESEVESANALGRIFGCDTSTSSSLIDCLEGKSAEEILTASAQVYPLFSITVDGNFLEDTPANLYKRDDFKHCPVLTGSNKDEGTLYFPPLFPSQITEPTLPYVDQQTLVQTMKYLPSVIFLLDSLSDDLVEQSILQEYIDWSIADNETANHVDSLLRIATDLDFTCPSDQVTRYHAAAGDNIFKYYFTHVPSRSIYEYAYPGISWMGASHAEEIPLMLGWPFIQEIVGRGFQLTDEEKALSVQVMTFWANFAKTGNPSLSSPDASPVNEQADWPAFTIPELAYKVIDLDLGEGRALKASECRFWNYYLPALRSFIADMDDTERDWKESFASWQTELSDWQSAFNAYKAAPGCN